MRRAALVAVLLLAIVAVAAAETFYKEEFGSQTHSDNAVTQPTIEG